MIRVVVIDDGRAAVDSDPGQPMWELSGEM